MLFRETLPGHPSRLLSLARAYQKNCFQTGSGFGVKTTAGTSYTALVRDLFGAFARRDPAAIRGIIADDAVWYFPGKHGHLAGEHRGRDAIARFLASVMALSDGTFSLDLQDVTASDENVVVLFTGSGRRNGKTLHNPTALHIRIEGEKAVEFREFVWDLDHVEDFWA